MTYNKYKPDPMNRKWRLIDFPPSYMFQLCYDCIFKGVSLHKEPCCNCYNATNPDGIKTYPYYKTLREVIENERKLEG